MTVLPLGGIPQTDKLCGLRNAKWPGDGISLCAGASPCGSPPNLSGGGF
jgi:hypothetical protein